VSDPKIQDGCRLPKWSPHAWLGQFLCYSKDHSTSIGLIRNISTGFVSPQFHVVHDDFLSTVPSVQDATSKCFDSKSWDAIVQTGLEKYLDCDSHALKERLEEQDVEFPQVGHAV